MGKPADKKGKIKIRAQEYVCKDCGYTAEKTQYEETLSANIIYDCPHCKKHAETTVPFKREKISVLDEKTMKRTAMESLRFTCGSCKKNIDVTKRMK